MYSCQLLQLQQDTPYQLLSVIWSPGASQQLLLQARAWLGLRPRVDVTPPHGKRFPSSVRCSTPPPLQLVRSSPTTCERHAVMHGCCALSLLTPTQKQHRTKHTQQRVQSIPRQIDQRLTFSKSYRMYGNPVPTLIAARPSPRRRRACKPFVGHQKQTGHGIRCVRRKVEDHARGRVMACDEKLLARDPLKNTEIVLGVWSWVKMVRFTLSFTHMLVQ